MPLDGVTFFLDRNLGRQIVATALRAAGADVRVHDDEFRPDTEDAEWLAVAGQRGWVVITLDRKIRYRQIERTALMNAGVRAFIVTASRVNGRVLAEILVQHLGEMVRFAETRPAPFIALLSRKGVRVIES